MASCGASVKTTLSRAMSGLELETPSPHGGQRELSLGNGDVHDPGRARAVASGDMAPVCCQRRRSGRPPSSSRRRREDRARGWVARAR